MRNDARKVREPVQVYLTTNDRKLLREVATVAGVSGAEVLRRGLKRMAGEILAERNPAMRLLEEMNSADWPAQMPRDVARRHDEHLADTVYPSPPRGSATRGSGKRGTSARSRKRARRT
jgi:hypothetical protein